TSDQRKFNTDLMAGLARAMTDEEITAAAKYFTSIPATPWITVVERETVPKTKAAGGMLLTRESAEADVEPIGERIIETPLSVRDTDFLRNPRSGFIAYVPQGSLIEGDPEFSRDDTIATAGERARQCLLRYTHAVGFSGVEASDAGVNCRVHGAL